MSFRYLGAGKSAPDGVRDAIEEFRRLPVIQKAEVPLLYYLLGSGTPPYKMSKRDSSYTARSPYPQNCANCASTYLHVRSGDYICDQIRGTIALKAWCRLWAAE